MYGRHCLIFSVLARCCISRVYFHDDLQTDIHNMRNKRDSCGEQLDLEESGGTTEIQLRTELFNGTEFYRVLEDCTWTLKTAKDDLMMIKSEYFSVEESTDCAWDYLEIREKDVNKTARRFCGWDPMKYITFSNEVTLQFKSDDSFEDQGFKLITKSIKKCLASNTWKSIESNFKIMNHEDLGEDCLYSVQAPEDKIITLNLRMLNFGSANCEEERIIISEGQRGEVLGTICSDTVNGMLPYRAHSITVQYRNTLEKEGERFTIEFMFVEDNFTPSTVPPTTPSPVGGDNDCSGLYKGIDFDDGVLVYTAPEYENNRECVVVVRNDQLPRHVVQIEFDYFDVEDSDNCTFDSLKIMSGERKESDLLGGPYCGDSLHGRTLLTRGNSLRFEFRTDESFAFRGFHARISFVPYTDCTCIGDKRCILQDYEKKCVHGRYCSLHLCQNGGTCIDTDSAQTCYCRNGFSGDDCSQTDGESSYHIRFIKAPTSRRLSRDESRIEECQVEAPNGEVVDYQWIFNGKRIGPYNTRSGFGSHPGGVLQIDKFSDGLEGQYACYATISADKTAEHTFEYRIAEACNIKIYPGPQSESRNIEEKILLSCNVDPPTMEVRWKKDGVYLRYDSRVKKLSNNYLQISKVEMSDAGVYQCEVSDRKGCYSYRQGTLNVKDVRPIDKYCGISIHDQAEQASRISSGMEARPNENPWHVTLRYRGEAQRHFPFCGGTLISQRYVVTAAHCITESKPPFVAENVELLLGTTDCRKSSNGIKRTINSVTIHPDYQSRGKYDNDIALIEMDRPVNYSDSVRPICVQTAEVNDIEFLEKSGKANINGKVTGCGMMSRDRRPSKLQQVHIPYVDTENCEKSLGKKHILTDTMFCAGFKNAKEGDSCHGDSGGGLVMSDRKRLVLTGIVSWAVGAKCDVDGQYGVYTNVGKFFDWIDTVSNFSREEFSNFLFLE